MKSHCTEGHIEYPFRVQTGQWLPIKIMYFKYFVSPYTRWPRHKAYVQLIHFKKALNFIYSFCAELFSVFPISTGRINVNGGKSKLISLPKNVKANINLLKREDHRTNMINYWDPIKISYRWSNSNRVARGAF